MQVVAQIVFSLGFGVIYAEMAAGAAGFEESVPIIGLIAVLAYLVAFFVPQALFRYTLKDVASTVLAQLSRRFFVAAAVTLALNIFIACVLAEGKRAPVPIIMEVYSATLIGLIIFHALGGLMAEQGNYLQRTSQYNTNQLFSAVLGISVLFVLLLMYFLFFDLATARQPRIYVRDMIYSTQMVAGFLWFVYRLAHH